MPDQEASNNLSSAFAVRGNEALEAQYDEWAETTIRTMQRWGSDSLFWPRLSLHVGYQKAARFLMPGVVQVCQRRTFTF